MKLEYFKLLKNDALLDLPWPSFGAIRLENKSYDEKFM